MNWMDGPMLGLDLEATGKDPMTALPVSFALVWYDQGIEVKRRTALINPGVPIPPETTEIHGISDEMVQERGGGLMRSVVGISEALLEASRLGNPVVGMVLRYDLTVIDQCLKRLVEGGGLREHGWNGPAFDVSVVDRRVDKWRPGSRKLTDLCKHYEVVLENAHTAVDDTKAALDVAIGIGKKYPRIANADVEALYVQQAGWRREWAIDFGEYLKKNDKEPLEAGAGNWPLATDEGISI